MSCKTMENKTEDRQLLFRHDGKVYSWAKPINL